MQLRLPLVWLEKEGTVLYCNQAGYCIEAGADLKRVQWYEQNRDG